MATPGQVFSFKKLALRRFPKTTEERNNAEEKYWSKYKVGGRSDEPELGLMN